MASLRIEGNLDGLRDIQIEFIRDVLEKRGYKDNRVVFEAVGQAGDNFIANVKRITTIVEDGDNFKMIAKFAPDVGGMRLVMRIEKLFGNETFMYEEVLPKLVSLQKAAGIPKEDTLRYAECYGCITEEPNEVVLLEDLNELNFVMLDRLSSLNDDAVRLVLKNFAILHSLSFVLKEREPETYEKYRNKLVDIWSFAAKDEQFQKLMVPVEEAAADVVDEKYKKLFLGAVTKTYSLSTELKEIDRDSKKMIIQQGDGWTNNILFKLECGKPTACIMIDYQVSQEASPVCDIMYMIFNCTNHITREKHYPDWIEYYHNQLDKALSYFGMNANTVYPKEALDSDLKRYAPVYFGTAVMINSMLSRKPEEALIVQNAMKEYNGENMENNMNMDALSSDTVTLYKSRLEGLIHSYRLFGYM